MYIFGFGSLVNIKSAQKSFKRELKSEDFIEVELQGFKKVWNSIESIVFEDESQPCNGIFLNLQKDETSSTSGILLEITPEEFENLKLREKNYSYIQIPNQQVLNKEIEGEIYTFTTTNKEKLAHPKQEACFIPAKYIKLLEEGLSIYSKSFSENFKTSYQEFLFPIKNGNYIFSDPIQNKFARQGVK